MAFYTYITSAPEVSVFQGIEKNSPQTDRIMQFYLTYEQIRCIIRIQVYIENSPEKPRGNVPADD